MTATDKITELVFSDPHIAEIDELDADCETRRECAEMLEDYINELGIYDRRTLRHVNFYAIAKIVRS